MRTWCFLVGHIHNQVAQLAATEGSPLAPCSLPRCMHHNACQSLSDSCVSLLPSMKKMGTTGGPASSVDLWHMPINLHGACPTKGYQDLVPCSWFIFWQFSQKECTWIALWWWCCRALAVLLLFPFTQRSRNQSYCRVDAFLWPFLISRSHNRNCPGRHSKPVFDIWMSHPGGAGLLVQPEWAAATVPC